MRSRIVQLLCANSPGIVTFHLDRGRHQPCPGCGEIVDLSRYTWEWA